MTVGGTKFATLFMAEPAARIGVVLRYAFQLSEALVSDGALTWRYLQAWMMASMACHLHSSQIAAVSRSHVKAPGRATHASGL